MNRRSLVRMKKVIPVRHFMRMGKMFSPKIRVLIARFLEQLSSRSRLQLVSILPQAYDFLPEGHFYKTLSFLKQQGVVTKYFVGRKEFDDDPHFYKACVLINGQERLSYSGLGRSLGSPTVAWSAAIGEAIERWSLDAYTPHTWERKQLLLTELKEQSQVDLRALPGMSDETRRRNDEEKKERQYEIDSDASFSCVSVRELTHDTPTWAPLQWFSFAHARDAADNHKEPVLSPFLSTGAAAGTSRTGAEHRAMLEIIERDTFMIHWLRGIAPDKIDIGTIASSSVTEIQNLIERYNFETHFLYLQTDFPVHIVMAVVLDRTGIGPAVMVDAAAGYDIAWCIEHAFLGVLGLRPFVRRNLGGKYDVSLKENFDPRTLSMEERAFWWASQDRISDIAFLLQGKIVSSHELPAYTVESDEHKRATLLQECRNRGYAVFSKEICSPDIVRNTGITAVSVTMPDIQPMHVNEWERCDQGKRLTEVPKELGLIATCKNNGVPHPFV